jgi:hypothetical protein
MPASFFRLYRRLPLFWIPVLGTKKVCLNMSQALHPCEASTKAANDT